MTTFSKDCLKGKRILITGGLGAIGRVAVGRLLGVSATIAVNDVVDDVSAAEIMRECGWFEEECTYNKADVIIPEEASGLVESAISKELFWTRRRQQERWWRQRRKVGSFSLRRECRTSHGRTSRRIMLPR